MRRAAALLLLIAVACAGSSGGDRVDVAQTESPSVTPTDPPPSGGPLLRFAVIGDWGSGSSQQMALADRMCSWRREHRFNLVITTGDNIYDAGEPEHFRDRFFRPYACLLNNGVRFRAVLGNHDIGTRNGRPELREDRFGMKGRNYVVRKNGVRFVMWESNYPDKEWLRRHLGEQRGDRWTVVSFHHPVFSPGPHGNMSGFSPSLPRLFRKKGVDLVVNGHDHLYALMPAKRRIRYVVTGGGGAGIYGCENPDVSEVCVERHHFLDVVAGEDRIVVRAVPISGPAFHTFATSGRD
jgi:predicted phosphodiesterase